VDTFVVQSDWYAYLGFQDYIKFAQIVNNPVNDNADVHKTSGINVAVFTHVGKAWRCEKPIIIVGYTFIGSHCFSFDATCA